MRQASSRDRAHHRDHDSTGGEEREASELIDAIDVKHANRWQVEVHHDDAGHRHRQQTREQTGRCRSQDDRSGRGHIRTGSAALWERQLQRPERDRYGSARGSDCHDDVSSHDRIL